ncbi:MAG: hypothetical protein IJ723_03250, partial [Ruminococcus sp.]|nr:hypothetical protein [Ruminococcus sp.]
MTTARSIVAAAAAVALLCFSSCGGSADKTIDSSAEETVSSSVSSLTEAESVTDEELLSQAKQTIEKFYGYANEGSYSEMTALCNEDIA